MYDDSKVEPSVEADTPNHTKFDGRDGIYDGLYRLDGIERYTDYYRRLAALNSGVFVGKWADESLRREHDNLAIFDSVASAVDLTRHQHRRGRMLFGQLSLRDLSTPGGIDAGLVAAMVAAHVAREDGRMYYPTRNKERNDGLFVTFLDHQGYSSKTIRSAYHKVGAAIDELGALP